MKDSFDAFFACGRGFGCELRQGRHRHVHQLSVMPDRPFVLGDLGQ
jgi:hypothetical protein